MKLLLQMFIHRAAPRTARSPKPARATSNRPRRGAALPRPPHNLRRVDEPARSAAKPALSPFRGCKPKPPKIASTGVRQHCAVRQGEPSVFQVKTPIPYFPVRPFRFVAYFRRLRSWIGGRAGQGRGCRKAGALHPAAAATSAGVMVAAARLAARRRHKNPGLN